MSFEFFSPSEATYVASLGVFTILILDEIQGAKYPFMGIGLRK